MPVHLAQMGNLLPFQKKDRSGNPWQLTTFNLVFPMLILAIQSQIFLKIIKLYKITRSFHGSLEKNQIIIQMNPITKIIETIKIVTLNIYAIKIVIPNINI